MSDDTVNASNKYQQDCLQEKYSDLLVAFKEDEKLKAAGQESGEGRSHGGLGDHRIYRFEIEKKL